MAKSTLKEVFTDFCCNECPHKCDRCKQELCAKLVLDVWGICSDRYYQMVALGEIKEYVEKVWG